MKPPAMLNAGVRERSGHRQNQCPRQFPSARQFFATVQIRLCDFLRVEAFLEGLAILDWTNSATHHYARLRCALEQAGTPIGNMDLLIASHAISEHSTLVTNNLKHFSRVPG
jgi:predicted nucleic acid-binding protein